MMSAIPTIASQITRGFHSRILGTGSSYLSGRRGDPGHLKLLTHEAGETLPSSAILVEVQAFAKSGKALVPLV